MIKPSFERLASAFQLHVYFCFKTHSRRPVFKGKLETDLVYSAIDDLCAQEDYHLLEAQVSRDHLRLLLSLKPEQAGSSVTRLMKGNLSRRFGVEFGSTLHDNHINTLWARGYFARSSGKVSIESARAYLESQAAHHGYRGRWTEALKFRNPEFRSPAFRLKHCLSILDYHVVVCTQFRTPLFDDVVAPRMFTYTCAIGKKAGFAVDRMTILPDHIHLLVQLLPSVSVFDSVLSFLNNTAYWMNKNYPSLLMETEAFQVWQPSFYAGTVGEFSTAQVRSFVAGAW